MQAKLKNADAVSTARRFADACEPLRDGRFTPISHWHERRHRQELFERFSLTFERLGDLNGKRGLDVGCGAGPYLLESLRRGASQMTGIDPALGTLELVRQQTEALGQRDRVTLVHGEFPDRRPSDTFDFAIVVGVLDYVAAPLAFLQALHEVVRGTSIVTFPSQHWLLTPLRKLSHWSRDSKIHFYTDASIRSLCERAGFRKIDITKIDGAGLDYHVSLTS
jgi:2-polyprenyl-3-methyl-5-hydroxy-6-metoxy-1,4-benzoquinol methylase